MSLFVFHIIEYVTVKTSLFIIENTLSIGYYIGSSAASYIYSAVTNKNKSSDVKKENMCNELDELKKELIQLRKKVDELEKDKEK